MKPLSFQELRKSLGLTQEQAAAALLLSIAAIQKMEQRESKCLYTRKFTRGNRRNFERLKEKFNFSGQG